MKPKMTVVLLLIAALLCACHTRPPKVDCEGRLSAIKAPAPAASESEKRP